MRQLATLLCFAAALCTIGCTGSKDYLARGKKFFDDAKYAEASMNFRKAIQKDPSSGDAYYNLALAAEKQNQLGEAVNASTRAVELMPQNEEAMVKLAELSFSGYVSSRARPKKFHDTVASMASRLLAKNPQSFDGLRLSGNIAMADQRPKDAIAYFQKANQIKPFNTEVVLNLTQALIMTGQGKEGEHLALQLIEKKKIFGPIYDVLYRLYMTTSREPEAEKLLHAKAANSPKEPTYLLQLAAHYGRAQKRDEMAQTLQRLNDNPAEFPKARIEVGDFYASSGNPGEARKQYEAGLIANPKDKLVYQLRIAALLRTQNAKDEAIRLLATAVMENPDSVEATTLRATVLLESGKAENLETALASLKEMTQRKPDNMDLRYHLGVAQMMKGDLKEAKMELQEALKKPSAQSRNARFQLAKIALDQNQPDSALLGAEQILAANPGNSQAQLLRAKSLIRLNRLAEARSELNRLDAQFQDAPEIQLELGTLAAMERKYGEAENILAKLRKPGPFEIRATVALAGTYVQQREFDKAIQLLSGEALKSPGPEIRQLLAEAAVGAKKYDIAIREYERLLAAGPKSVDIQVRLGNIYREKGDFDKALRLIQEARQLAPKDPNAAISFAGTLLEAGKPQEALAIYQQMAAAQPEDADLMNNIAFALCETGGNLDRALGFSRRALQKSPDQPGFLDTLGWVYLKKGMVDDALQIYNGLAKKNPENPTFRYHLGASLLKKGYREKARIELISALAKRPQASEQKRIQELLDGLK